MLKELYNHYIYELADPRTKDWVFLQSPLPATIFACSYLYFVLHWGPNFMKNRKPYQFTKFITFYNIAQVLACCYIIKEFYAAGWNINYFWKCYPVDYSNKPNAIRMLNTSWFTLVLKCIEFTETILFVLRKKQKQVSFLHVYHHVTTFMMGWMFTKYMGGGILTFGIVLNCIIHIIMYSYYLLAVYEIEIIKKFKSYITMMQMVQFTLVFINAAFAYQNTCPISKPYIRLSIPYVGVIFYLFYDFYRKSYNKKVRD